MSKLYACIISKDAKKDREALLSIADQFAYGIEVLDDGVLMDLTGLEKLIGSPEQIEKNIVAQLKNNNVSGTVAVADKIDSAILLARENKGSSHSPVSSENFQKLPLRSLEIDKDTLGVFEALGVSRIEDLQQIPADELISRYGQEFKNVIDVIEQNGDRLLVPNLKENHVAWSYDLDFTVANFDQLIFFINHALGKLLNEVSHYGFSTEQMEVSLRLDNKTERTYEIKTSFPSLERSFWLKLINLRISLDPPESGIVYIKLVSRFTRPRPAQSGLFAATRPEPESLLLTINKIKKLVGEQNVGVPALLDQRIAEAFTLDAEKIPAGKEKLDIEPGNPVIAFNFFDPPLSAEVLVRKQHLLFLKTCVFQGRVEEYSGVWKAASRWWGDAWNADEWDVQIENKGVYRLCRKDNDWFVIGVYD